MNLEIGMYVRTNKGEIFDCIESEQMGKPIYYPKNSKTNGYIDYNEVYKKANNIIDICEVGDYVNGERIQFITNKKELLTDGGYDLLKKYECISSILTKEQFESMEYKVKE